ncbi:MAG: 1-acyl-sn-glycerol-3-phosphate acyltransferase [Deltaproteobacteria bacterium]|nr:1-acyl-sn-glycerol-3-phosphate acyltransferase [Deltaproteobacteria bacterium]
MSKPTRLSLNNFKKKIRGWIDTVLEGTHNHYLSYLPTPIGWLSSGMLKLFFSGIKCDKTQTAIIENIPKDAIIIYVIKFKSYFDYLFYYTRYKQEGLPVPEIGFDYRIFFWQPVSRLFKVFLAFSDYLFHNRTFPDPYKSGYIRQELLNGRAGFLSLVEKRGFYRWFVKAETDPIRYLIEMQKSMDRPIYMIPQLMFFGKKPIPSIQSIIDVMFGTEQRPGKIRRLITLFKNPEKIFFEISEPVNLKLFTEHTKTLNPSIEHQSLILRRNLLLQINRHRQSITGPVLKLREELKESILTNDRLQNFMNQHSKKRAIPIQAIYKEADSYLEEIAANYSMAIIKIVEVIVRWMINLMYEGVTVNTETLNRIKSMAKKGPIIFLPCHKSHIDYLILSYIMYHNNMPCPHVAAGKNLSFWPVGSMFRGGGAFFIRRTFKGAVLYAKVFAEYIHKLLEESFNVEFFIEGGRSRTGKLLTPKLGLLSILLNAYKNGACEDMIFAPVFIGYDRVLEESSYMNEIEGGQKKPESLLQVIKARKLLKKRYGRIYIQFHEPISLNELLVQYDMTIQDMTSKELNSFCRRLGNRILNAIDGVSVITPHALVASAILNCAKKRFSYDHLMNHIETYMAYLFSQEAKMTDTLVIDHVRAVDQVLDSYAQRKFIERLSTDKDGQSSDKQFTVNVSKRPLLEYYKNNCISFFIPAAFTALAILEKDAFQLSAVELHSGYSFFQEFFNNEFAYNADRTPEYLVRKSIKAFIDEAILMPHPTLPDTYNLTSEGFRKLKFYSRFLKTYFESYWIVLNHLKRYPQNSMDSKERLKKIQSMGNHMYKQKEIELKEALSKVTYNNALDFFTKQGVKGSGHTEKIEFYGDAIQKYLNILQV